MADMNNLVAKRDDVSDALILTDGAATLTALSGMDEQHAIFISNTDTVAAGIVVEAGDGMRASIGKLFVTVPAGEMRLINLDSSRFKKLRGENCGKYVVKVTKAGNDLQAFDGTIAKVKLATIHL